MASLFRNSRSIITRFSSIRRTAATVVASNTGTQVKTSGATTNRPTDGGNLPARDAHRRLTPADAIKPRAAGEPSFIPLVGKALTVPGQMLLGLFLALSAYFTYINYIKNPEFYKSLKISREASKRDSHSAKEGGGH